MIVRVQGLRVLTIDEHEGCLRMADGNNIDIWGNVLLALHLGGCHAIKHTLFIADEAPLAPLFIGMDINMIKKKHFPRYWAFVRGIHRTPVNSPHKGQWRGALMYSLICAWINGWVNNREAGDLRRHRAHYDVTVILQ